MEARYPETAAGRPDVTGKDTGKDAVSLFLEPARVFDLYQHLKAMFTGVSRDGANGGSRTHTGANPLEPKSK
jgi:hypothetical protein